MIENKRNLDKIETEVHKKPRDATLSLEIPWVSVVEWKEQLSGLNDLVSFPDKVAKMKETMVTRVQKIKIDGKVHEFAGHVLWLDIAEDIPVYVVLENSINKSFFDQKITREEILGLSREGVDVTIYSHAQNTFIESGQTDNDLRIKLKANMARKSRPLLSLKWDGRGDVLEVVWLQASGGFDDYVAINGRVLQSLLTLFAELFPPRRMTILADQAKSGNLLIRKFYPFIKDVYHCGPGYYGNWGFVPADCWGVQDVDGNVIFQSRELYYSAVEFLRNIPLKELNLNFDDTMEGETLHSVLKKLPASHFNAVISQFYDETQSPIIEMAKKVILETQIWEKRADMRSEHGFTAFLLFPDNAFERFFGENDKEAYQSLVTKALGSLSKPCWKDSTT